MYKLNEDLSIYVTRGDAVLVNVKAEFNGKPYTFMPDDLVRFKVFKKKNASAVVLQKDFTIETPTQAVQIFLDRQDTKIGTTISKPVDYWYEVELNPLSDPQTIIGYDEDGAKVFKLFPEGADKEVEGHEPDTEEEKLLSQYMDDMLDLSSTHPVQNNVITAAIRRLEATHTAVAKLHATPQMYGAVGDGVADDTEAFKSMVADKKDITIPEGKYLITDTITLGDNVDINGTGATVLYHGTGALFEINSYYTNRAKIKGLRVQGNGENGFIKCDNVSHWGASFILEGCHVSNFGGRAIELVGGYSIEIKDTVINHVSDVPCIVSSGASFSNVVKLTNTVFLGDETRVSVFVDTTNLICLLCDSTTFEYGDKAVIGSKPAHFVNCWFERLNMIAENTNSTMIRCNIADCKQCIDVGDGVSLQPRAYINNLPNMGDMSVGNAIAEMMSRDEFTIDNRLAEGTYNGKYYAQEISKMTNKGMCYNVPLNLLAASGTPDSNGVFYMYRVPPFANAATYKLTLVGVTNFSNGSRQVTHANALLKGGVLIEYHKTDNHTEGNYDGVFGYDKSNGAFFFKNVSANVANIDLMVEFNLVAFS